MVNKNKFFKKYLKKKNVLNKANFSKKRNSYKRALQEKKQSYMAQTFIKIKNDMRQTWKNINRQLGNVKISSYASLSINNITIDDPKQITNHFNDYFVNIASKLVSNLPQLPHNFQTYLPSPTLNSLYFQLTTLFEIKKLVNYIQPKNSFGTDEVPASILKTTPDNVLFALTHVFNLSLINGDFILGFKKDNVTNVSNYQPITFDMFNV